MIELIEAHWFAIVIAAALASLTVRAVNTIAWFLGYGE